MKTLDSKIIDCNGRPIIPNNFNTWKVAEHILIPGGKLDLSKIGFVSPNHKHCISGHEYLNKVKNNKEFILVNANIIDHLLEYQDDIPKECLGTKTLFFGTTFSINGKVDYVRSLCPGPTGPGYPKWHSHSEWLSYAGLCSSGTLIMVYYP